MRVCDNNKYDSSISYNNNIQLVYSSGVVDNNT